VTDGRTDRQICRGYYSAVHCEQCGRAVKTVVKTFRAHVYFRGCKLRYRINCHFNAILSKVGRFASEEVVISLIYAKCLLVLLYSTEACRILVRDKRSLEFTVTRSLMKLLQTSSATIIQDCQKFFYLLPVSCMIDIRTAKFLENFIINDYYDCRLFAHAVWIKKFLSYGDNIFSSSDLKCIVSDRFFCMMS